MRKLIWIAGGLLAGTLCGVLAVFAYARFVGPDDPPLGEGLIYLFIVVLCGALGLITGILRAYAIWARRV